MALHGLYAGLCHAFLVCLMFSSYNVCIAIGFRNTYDISFSLQDILATFGGHNDTLIASFDLQLEVSYQCSQLCTVFDLRVWDMGSSSVANKPLTYTQLLGLFIACTLVVELLLYLWYKCKD